MAEETQKEKSRGADAPAPTPPSNDRHSIFSMDNVVVFIVAELIAAPLCIAGGDQFVKGEFLKAVFGYGVGVPIGAVGFTFPFWKNRVSLTLNNYVLNLSLWLIPAIIAVSFLYIVGPYIYNNIVSIPRSSSISTTDASTPTDVFSLIKSLRDKLTSANNTVDAQKETIKSLQVQLDAVSHPPAKVGPLSSASLTIKTTKDSFDEQSAFNARWMEWDAQHRGDEIQWTAASFNSANSLLTLQSQTYPDLSNIPDGEYEFTKSGNTYHIYEASDMTLFFIAFDKPVDTDKMQLSASSTLPQWHDSCSQNALCSIWFDQRPENNTTFTIQVGQR
jgi:hypothetical protein